MEGGGVGMHATREKIFCIEVSDKCRKRVGVRVRVFCINVSDKCSSSKRADWNPKL